MDIIAIDPGPVNSAWLHMQDGVIKSFAIWNNDHVVGMLEGIKAEQWYDVVIEMVASYGMPVGADVFYTCKEIGRFEHAAEHFARVHLVYRRDIKMHLCHSMRAKDGNVRQALIDKYPPTGGGKTPQIGTKSKPGPLFGIKADIWSALAIAVCWQETHKGDEHHGRNANGRRPGTLGGDCEQGEGVHPHSDQADQVPRQRETVEGGTLGDDQKREPLAAGERQD